MAASSTAMTVAIISDEDSQDDSQPFTTFHLFPKLPEELRLMIWELILPGPRIVKLKIFRSSVRMADWLRDWDEMIGGPRPGNIKYSPEDFEFPNIPPPFNQWGSPIPRWHGVWHVKGPKVPTILFVNQESRRIGMKIYDKMFRCVGKEALTWFSYKQDTLYLSSELVDTIQQSPDMDADILGIDFSKIRRLLLGSGTCHSPNHARLKCKVIGWFGQLKHLTLVSENPDTLVCDTLVDLPWFTRLNYLVKLYSQGYIHKEEAKLQAYLRTISNDRQYVLAKDVAVIANEKSMFESRQVVPKNMWNWEMPIIDRQTITSAECKEEYDKALELYNHQKAYGMDVILTVWGGENFQYTASQTSTVWDMIQAFRAAKRYSKKKVINVQCKRKILEPETRILDIENIDLYRYAFLKFVF